MSDATALSRDVLPLLPLRISAVEFQAGVLTVTGHQWSLNLIGDWEWSREGLVVTESGAPDAEDAAWDLCGADLIEIQFPDPAFDEDCTFVLSDGALDARSDRSGWETWTFRHDHLPVVYVGI